MDRFAVFVDAGYLYAETGRLLFNTTDRRAIQLDGPGANEMLVNLAKKDCGLSLLRTYWYDGARNGVPTMDQEQIAALLNVKLRLGRINSKNQQKGVDALIILDLVTLARERAISEAYLLSGDEDLREGVRAAQDLGVRVTLIGIPTRGNTFNQSKELVNEADQSTMLTKNDIDKLATLIQPRQAPAHKPFSQADPVAGVSAAATKYTRQWLSRSTHEELKSMQEGRPIIPRALDASLLDSIENEVGISLRRREGLRREARQTFWRLVARAGQNKSTSTATTMIHQGGTIPPDRRPAPPDPERCPDEGEQHL